MMQLLKTLFALAFLGVVGWRVYLEAGWATATCVGLIFAAIAGLDARTRFRGDLERDAFARMTRTIEDMQADPDQEPNEKEGGGE